MSERTLFSLRALVVLLALLCLALLLSVSGRKPISYLHSWNQVTTLVTIRGVGEGEISVLEPKEVVARVTWRGEVNKKLPWRKDPRFAAFEEFPLYHGLAGLLVQRGLSPERAGHLLSILLWGITAFLLYRLALCSASRPVAYLATLLYLSSFPILYYGQAIMSDIGMVCGVVLALLLLQKERAAPLFAALSLAVAALFKSYAAIFTPLLFLRLRPLPLRRWKALRVFCSRALLVLLTITPVACWHLYASMQPGNHEVTTHSLSRKVQMIVSFEFYETLLEGVIRYLGIVPFSLLLIATPLWWYQCRGSSKELSLPPWLPLYSCCLAAFFLATAEKLPYHDYYFLFISPPLFLLAAALLTKGLRNFCAGSRSRLSIVFIALLGAVHCGLTLKSFLKAVGENPDVIACARAVKGTVAADAMIGTLADVSRFNSLQYYSDRVGLTFESTDLPLSQYLTAGVNYVVINASPDEYASFEEWLLSGDPLVTPLRKLSLLTDAKGRARVCGIFTLTPTTT